MEKEEFLVRLTGSDEEEAATTPRLQYYNKVQASIPPSPAVTQDLMHQGLSQEEICGLLRHVTSSCCDSKEMWTHDFDGF